MWDLAEVGAPAPALALCEHEEFERHRPRLLAFVRSWSIEAEPLERVRERVAELDTELIIVCDDGAWSFTRDHDVRFCDRLAADVVTASAVYGVKTDAVFVIDHRGVIRFAHRPESSLSATLTEALDAAGEAMQFRSHLTPFECVKCSLREWECKCLVVGCALTFVAQKQQES
jgi:hypothetical protein